MASDDNLKRLGDFIDVLFPDQGKAIAKWVPVLRQWGKIVGNGLDCHSVAREVNRGMLLVDVDHPAWMNLFQMRQDEILAKLQRAFPDFQIRSIRLRLVSDLRNPPVEPEPLESAPTETRQDVEAIPPDLDSALKGLFDLLRNPGEKSS